MNTRYYKFKLAIGILMAFGLAATAAVAAGTPKEMGGWELGSPYNKHYKASELDSLRAEVVKVAEVVPMAGMAPGVALQVKESGDEVVEVQVCPSWYIEPGNIGLKRGDKVKIRGVWAEIDGRDVFLVSKIKKGDYFTLKVRLTKDGTPFWTMSPEELAKEKQATED
ncbi:MAG: hypothetical protein WAM73_09700 [Desulfobacterales bacterium]